MAGGGGACPLVFTFVDLVVPTDKSFLWAQR